jgi:hypothetical protein
MFASFFAARRRRRNWCAFWGGLGWRQTRNDF